MATTTKRLVFEGSWRWLFFWAALGGLSGWLLIPVAVFYYLRHVHVAVIAE